MFSKVLIANRGEIAVRISQTLQEMGIGVVAVYSEPDRRSPHILHANEACFLEGQTAGETYLRGDRIIEIAKRHGADAIHPGYGFLSENADFARACQECGIKFIGPSPDVIRRMGDKVLAKQIMADAGVPVVPGWSPDADIEASALRQAAAEIGYPVLVKAAAGGGGKGMRVVQHKRDLQHSLEAAQREANAAFGDSRVFLEKYLDRPRHVEFQIFGDEQGNVVHLCERECSIQRRHQKIVEESPSPVLTPALRERMGEAAVRAARAIGYTNAGTVEFLVDSEDNFYFLEVNTRLQVEHPVTEMVLCRDLVRTQVAVAAGEPLPFTQEQLQPGGHAIECRIYAEDAARGFLPSTGTIEHFAPPSGTAIRVDSGVCAGSVVSVHYDPMLAKLIVWAPTRAVAIERMGWALDRFAILGVTTNVEFLGNLMRHPAFQAGDLHTHFLEEHEVAATREEPVPEAALIAAAFMAKPGSFGNRATTSESMIPVEHASGPWQTGHDWRAF